MNILEYEAKDILSKFSIPVPRSVLYRRGDAEPTAPVVLKSQVHSGGRGKVGGVKVIHEQYSVETTANSIFELAIRQEKPRVLLAEEVLDIEHEYYLSLVIDRVNAGIELVAHQQGGIDIEAHDPSEFFKKAVDTTSVATLGESVAEYYGLENQSFALSDLLQNLYKCFVESDATLLEINPLVLTTDGNLVAGDCKLTLDDAAGFRHPDWQFEQAPTNANFVTLDPNGTVATIANGAGLAMATVDAVKAAGLTPANFLDIGGGATVGGIMRSFESIMEFPSITAIVVNIFGGIVRCDEVASALLEAREQFENLPKLYIRLSGTRSAEATELLAAKGLPLYPDLTSCLQELQS